MFCSKCGISLPEEAVVCYKCATPTQNNINFVSNAKSSQESQSKTQQPTIIIKNRSPFGAILAAFILLVGAAIIIGGIGLYAYQYKKSHTYNDSSPMFTSPLATTHPLLNETFKVGPNQYYSTHFNVASGARIVGDFYAKGGMKNDIECVIFDNDGFQNFQNGNLASKIYYNSKGYVTTAKIDKDLPAGQYVLVFNNTDAIFYGKTVTAKISLGY